MPPGAMDHCCLEPPHPAGGRGHLQRSGDPDHRHGCDCVNVLTPEGNAGGDAFAPGQLSPVTPAVEGGHEAPVPGETFPVEMRDETSSHRRRRFAAVMADSNDSSVD